MRLAFHVGLAGQDEHLHGPLALVDPLLTERRAEDRSENHSDTDDDLRIIALCPYSLGPYDRHQDGPEDVRWVRHQPG